MKNKLLEIDLNEADEYDFDDFTQNLESVNSLLNYKINKKEKKCQIGKKCMKI